MQKFDFIPDGIPYGICRFSDISDGLLNVRSRARLPENAGSVIVFLFPYKLPEEYCRERNISKYAVPRDYHITVTKLLSGFCGAFSKLCPQNKFIPFADSSPIPEVRAAALSGLGKTGKNGLFQNADYGSFVFIGEIVTDAVFEPYEGKAESCINCGLCEKACPAGAIKDGKIDRNLCLSAVTQRKGELTAEEKNLIRKTGCAWGCDICQDVCPANKNAKITPISDFYTDTVSRVTAETPPDGRAFAWRGPEVIKRNLMILNEKT